MNISLTNITKVLFWLLLGLLVLGQFGRIQLTQNIALYLHDLVVVVLLSVWVIWKISSHKKLYNPIGLLEATCFSFTLIVSWIINWGVYQNSSLVGGLYLARFMVLLGLFWVVADIFSYKMIYINVKRSLLYVSLAIASLGVLQYVWIPDTRFLYAYGWDDHLNRLISTWFDPSFTGLVLILGYVLLLTGKKPRFQTHLLDTATQTLLLVAIVLTYSRASYLVLGSFYLGYFVTKPNKNLIVSGLIFVLLVALVPRTLGEGVRLERVQSVQSRINSSTDAVELFTKYPLWGIGFNNYRIASDQTLGYKPNHTSSPDNSLILILVTSGLVGFTAFIVWIGRLLRWSWKHSPSLFWSLGVVMIHSLTNNSFFYPFILLWIGLLYGWETTRET